MPEGQLASLSSNPRLPAPSRAAEKKAPYSPEITGGTHQPSVPSLNAAALSDSGGCLGHGWMGRDVQTAAVWIQLLWSSTQNASPEQHPDHPLCRKQAFKHLL